MELQRTISLERIRTVESVLVSIKEMFGMSLHLCYSWNLHQGSVTIGGLQQDYRWPAKYCLKLKMSKTKMQYEI